MSLLCLITIVDFFFFFFLKEGMMKENSGGKYGSSSSQKSMKEKERHMVNKIQGIFTNLQSARKESRATDILIIEEQMHQLLREWKAELESPATSLNVCLSILIRSSNNTVSVFIPHPAKRYEIYVFICICWHSIGWEPWVVSRGISPTVARI